MYTEIKDYILGEESKRSVEAFDLGMSYARSLVTGYRTEERRKVRSSIEKNVKD